MRKSLSTAFIGAFMALAGAGIASASITVSNPMVTAGGPVFTWTYGIAGDGFEDLVPGSYFTIYDFQGYVAGSAVAPAGWTVSVQLLGTTPSGQLLTDSGTLPNLTFTYTGAKGPVPTLSGFQAQSIFGYANTNGGIFSYTALNITTNALDQGQGITNVPQAPEPVTVSLLGCGLAIIGVLRFRRK